jgi:hypothetical protein
VVQIAMQREYVARCIKQKLSDGCAQV